MSLRANFIVYLTPRASGSAFLAEQKQREVRGQQQPRTLWGPHGPDTVRYNNETSLPYALEATTLMTNTGQ